MKQTRKDGAPKIFFRIEALPPANSSIFDKVKDIFG
jgi:hypothetical protein